MKIELKNTKSHSAEQLLQHITMEKQLCHTLIIFSPDCQTVTLLNDLTHFISNGNECVKQSRVRIIKKNENADDIISLIRSLLPQVIIINELEEANKLIALEYAMHCGCKLLVTVQGDSIDDIMTKPLFGQWIKEKRFERYVILKSKQFSVEIESIYNDRGSCIQLS